MSSKCANQVDSVSAYLAVVKDEIKKWDDEIGLDNDYPEEDKPTMKVLFRGHGNKEWRLWPSLFRCLPSIDSVIYSHSPLYNSYYGQEEYLIKEAMRLFPDMFKNAENNVGLMAICQHYAIPTRLLDVTANALVGLYFAVSAEKDKDGVVYLFRVNAEENERALSASHTEKITFDRYHEQGKDSISWDRPLLVFPSHKTERQKAQDGCFFLFENKVNPLSVIEFNKSDFRRIEISAGMKDKLKNELENICNIHKGTLFPESLDSYVEKIKAEAEKRIKANHAS